MNNMIALGGYPYIKHFALNDQETGRWEMLCTWTNEQSMRELYFKPFETCIKDNLAQGGASAGHPMAVMSSYNYIGTQWAGACKDILYTGVNSRGHAPENIDTGLMSWQIILIAADVALAAGAMLKAIMGEINPSGKLAESYPVKYEDMSSAPYFPAKQRSAEYREGLYVGYRYYETANVPVLFSFGFGLSYTTFEYSDLKVSDKEATFTLKNTGSMDGAEVARLYVSKLSSEVFHSAKELKGF